MNEQVQIPPFCQRCEGHGAIAKVARHFQTSVYDGQPWSGTVDQSDDAKLDVIRSEECPRCHGIGHEQ